MTPYVPAKTRVTAYKRTRPGKHHTEKTVAVRKHMRRYKKALRGGYGDWRKSRTTALALQKQFRREPDRVGCRLDGRTKITEMDQALCYVGGLSDVDKLPGYSWSLCPMDCKTGMSMRGTPGSVCNVCYATGGRYYAFGTFADSHARKLNAWASDRERWLEAMDYILNHSPKIKQEPYFRFFDSGDIYSKEMLDDIATLARDNPDVKFWVPTKEYRLVGDWTKNHTLPENMVIRVSHRNINHEFSPDELRTHGHVSYVWDPTTGSKTKGFVCPAYKQGGRCGTCRACWNNHVKEVIYKIH